MGRQGALPVALPEHEIFVQGAVSIPCMGPPGCDLHHQANATLAERPYFLYCVPGIEASRDATQSSPGRLLGGRRALPEAVRRQAPGAAGRSCLVRAAA